MPDPILLWNKIALEANRVSHTNGQGEQTGPTLSSRALAIVHLAMYDAFAGITNTPAQLPRYINNPPSVGGATPEALSAAVAAAAYTALVALFPSQKPFFDGIFEGEGDPASAAHAFGVAVAQAILLDRAMDPGASGGYKPSPLPGKHRPDPDNAGQGFYAPLYGALSKGFGITARHELAAPPFGDSTYLDALKEVRGKGIAPDLAGTLPGGLDKRTPDETVIGIYWGYDGASEIGTPPRLYNQIVRKVAIAQNNTPAQNARLFAFVNVAMADAGILAWDQKYIHNFWRPVVGIREHDASFGPAAPEADNDISNDADPQWLPLGAPNTNRVGPGSKNFTPNFPAYPSGHATFGAAAFHITRLFYGQGGTLDGTGGNALKKDTLFNGLDFVSDEFNGISVDIRGTVRPRHRRNFPDGLWNMILENGRSRVLLGVHWVFDAFFKDTVVAIKKKVGGKYTGGVPLGLVIAEDVFNFGNGKAPKKSTVPPATPAAAPAAMQGAETFSSTFRPDTPGR
jgi:vanadium chloroperoxidase